MKRKGTGKKNRITAAILAGCICLAVCVTDALNLYQPFRDINPAPAEEAGEKDAADKQDTPLLLKETKAVKARENQAPAASYEEDKRSVIRILEIVENGACSVFPYFIDWKSEEGYNENTYLGYEGIRMYALKQGENQKYYGVLEKGIPKDYLDNYNVSFTQAGDNGASGLWWRESHADENLEAEAYGYFERVPTGKGLYYINPSQFVDEDVDKASGNKKYGIRYRTMAMARKGTENKKGEWEVKDARYFLAKDFKDDAGALTGITKRTDFNYDLQFSAGVTASSGIYAGYRVKSAYANASSNKAANGRKYEYEALWDNTAGAGNAWEGGYIYRQNGNYNAVVTQEYQIREGDVIEDKVAAYPYVWIPDKGNLYSQQTGSKGHFRLANAASDTLQPGDFLYQLNFNLTASAGAGSYILNPSAVETLIKKTGEAISQYQQLQFRYAKDGKGIYDVAFYYCGTSVNTNETGVLYTAAIAKVADGAGRYALTSASTGDLYEKKGSGQGDYSQVVTRIDCAGIDYSKVTTVVNQWYSYDTYYQGYCNENGPGLFMGCGQYTPGVFDDTKANWVFHKLPEDKTGITKVDEFENGEPKKIYVYRQKRKGCYYNRLSFESSEWFKLLMYIPNASGTAGIAYEDYMAGQLKPLQIKEKYKKELNEFDSKYRIEIKQRTPGEVSKQEIEEADLLYINSAITLQNLAASWDTVADAARASGRDIPYLSGYKEGYTFTTDFSVGVLMTIYRNCLYDQNTALLFGGWADSGGLGAEVGTGNDVRSNLGKMFLFANLFIDPRNFALFIDGYPEKMDAYTTIYPENATVEAYKQNLPGIGTLYNFGKTAIYDEKWYKPSAQELESLRLAPEPNPDVWQKEYFRVVKVKSLDVQPGPVTSPGDIQWEMAKNYGDDQGEFGYYWGFSGDSNYRGEDVKDPDRCWYISGNMLELFWKIDKLDNIWKILHNKKSKQSSVPAVVVTNADGDNISEQPNIVPVYYYYVSAYSRREDYDIKFKISWIPDTITEPTPLASITFGGSSATPCSYETEITCNVADDFLMDDGNGNEVLNPAVTSKEYEIEAVDVKGNSDVAKVIVIARESFMLN